MIIDNVIIEGNPSFNDAVKKLQKIFDLRFSEQIIRKKTEIVGQNSYGVFMVFKPKIEKGRINVDINEERLCEINTLDKNFRIAAHSFPSSFNNYTDHKQHLSTYFEKDEFYSFLIKWINEKTGVDRYIYNA